MKEHRNDMDNVFRDKLNQMNFDVPEDFLADLNGRLDAANVTQKKRRKGFFFFFGTFVVLISGIILFNGISTDKTNISSQADLNSDDKSKSVTASKLAIESNEMDRSNSDQKDQYFIHSKASQPSLNVNSTSDNREVNILFDAKKVSRAERPSQNGSGGLKKDKTNNPAENDGLLLPENDKVVLDESSLNDNTLTEIQKDEFIQTDESNPIIEKDEIAIENEKAADEVISDEQISMTIPAEVPLVVSPLKKINKMSWMLQTGGGLTFSSPAVRGTNPSFTNSSEKEQGLWSPAVELGLSMQYGSFALGVNPLLTQIGERSTFDIVSPQIVDSVYQNGSTWQEVWNNQTMTWDSLLVPNYDTTQVTAMINESVMARNTFSRIQIPVNFGYAFGWRSWTFIPSAGIVFDVALNKKTGLFPNGSNSSLSTYTPSSFVFSYSLQAEVRRNFGQWNVFVRPRFTSMFKPIIETDNSSRKYNQWNVMMGIGYTLR